MALLVMVRVSLGHLETFMRLLDILLGQFTILKRDKSPDGGKINQTIGID